MGSRKADSQRNLVTDGVGVLVSGLSRCVLLALVCAVGLAVGVAQAAAAPESPRIIGGSPASPGTWPWLAFVENSLPGGGFDLCTGPSSRRMWSSQPGTALWMRAP